MKIYIVGKAVGSYRNQNFLKIMSENSNTDFYYNGYYDNCSKSGKLINILSFPLDLIRMMKSDVVYVLAMQHDSYLVKLAAFLKKRIITDFYISFYDTAVNDRKIAGPDSSYAQKLYKKDRRALNVSSSNLFLNLSEARHFCKAVDIDINEIKYDIVPLCIDSKPQAELDFFKNKRNCLNLCWTGTYIPLQGLDKIIDAMKIVKDRKVRCHLYIWGDTDKKAEPFVEKINKMGLDDYITVHNEWGNISNWVSFITKTCDVTLGIFGDSQKAKNVLANKVLDGAAFRTPVITGHSFGLSEYFDGKDDIFTVDNNPESIAAEIEKIISADKDDILKRVDNTYRIYENNFTFDRYRDNIHKVLNK